MLIVFNKNVRMNIFSRRILADTFVLAEIVLLSKLPYFVFVCVCVCLFVCLLVLII
jgi:hypothetical protein